MEILVGGLTKQRVMELALCPGITEIETSQYAIRGNERRIERAVMLLYEHRFDDLRSYVKHRDLPFILEVACIVLWEDAREHLASRERSPLEILIAGTHVLSLRGTPGEIYISRIKEYFNLQ